MKSVRAERIKVKIGDLWESPLLHVLLTKEDDVVVACCLDFSTKSCIDFLSSNCFLRTAFMSSISYLYPTG